MQTTFPAFLSDDAMVAIPLLMRTILNNFPALARGSLQSPRDYAISSCAVSEREDGQWHRQTGEYDSPSAVNCSARRHFWDAVITRLSLSTYLNTYLHLLHSLVDSAGLALNRGFAATEILGKWSCLSVSGRRPMIQTCRAVL